MSRYDEGPTYGIGDPQDGPEHPVCCLCGWAFRHGETLYRRRRALLCGDCLREDIERRAQTDLWGLAQRLGWEPEKHDERGML